MLYVAQAPDDKELLPSLPNRREQMTDIHSAQTIDLPGSELDVAKVPGHWLLARLGKRP